jgi:hypothetical protein
MLTRSLYFKIVLIRYYVINWLSGLIFLISTLILYKDLNTFEFNLKLGRVTIITLDNNIYNYNGLCPRYN